MIERPQWYRPSAAARAGLALLSAIIIAQALFGLVGSRHWKGSTDPCDGFKLSLVSDA